MILPRKRGAEIMAQEVEMVEVEEEIEFELEEVAEYESR